MSSLEELNAILGLDGATNKVVEWSPMHLHLCEVTDWVEDNLKNFPDYETYLRSFTEQGLALTGISDGEIYCMFGVYEFWHGMAEAWMLPSKHLNRKTIVFHRAALRFFEYIAEAKALRRLQITVNAANVHADRWARRCYFEREGLMRRYGPDGNDYWMYSRLF